MSMQLSTLLALILAVFIGFRRKVNTGLIGILFAFFMGVYMLGIPVKTVVGGFPASLFVTLAGMIFLFSIAKVNGTMNMVALTIIGMARGNLKLLPIIFFITSAIISAVGPGPIVVGALMSPVAYSVAEREDIHRLLMGCMVMAGCLTGGLSPLSPSGIVANTYAQSIGVTEYTKIFVCVSIASAMQGAIYYIIFGGFKLKMSNTLSQEAAVFNADQKRTLIVILCAVLSMVFLKSDVGLTGFAAGTILLLMNPKIQKETIANMSWDTLMLISGVAMLINVISKAGGIKALIDFLSAIMSPGTSTAVMAAISGLMSTVSSASGVVMPTLIPTAAGIAENMGAPVTAIAIVASIVAGSHSVTYSPFSTLGALNLASAGEKTDKQKLFIHLIVLEVGNLIFTTILGLLGFYVFITG